MAQRWVVVTGGPAWARARMTASVLDVGQGAVHEAGDLQIVVGRVRSMRTAVTVMPGSMRIVCQ